MIAAAFVLHCHCSESMAMWLHATREHHAADRRPMHAMPH